LKLLDREKRGTQRRLKAARFPNYKTLEDFDFAAQPSLNRVLVAELMRCQYIEEREAVILIGNPGTGKTHVATALAIEACHRGYHVLDPYHSERCTFSTVARCTFQPMFTSAPVRLRKRFRNHHASSRRAPGVWCSNVKLGEIVRRHRRNPARL
jgi:chromosomal replication initiation ATPase DnaA